MRAVPRDRTSSDSFGVGKLGGMLILAVIVVGLATWAFVAIH